MVTNDELMDAIKENTEINKELLKLLKQNNLHTKAVYDFVEVSLSPEQQTKDFLLNVGANLLGNSITVPTLVNLNNK